MVGRGARLWGQGPALVPVWPPPPEPVTWPSPAGRLDFDGLEAMADAFVTVEDVIAGRGRPHELRDAE